MREELTIRLLNLLQEYEIPAQEIRLKLTILLADYEIEARYTELAIPDENKNIAMLQKFLAAKLAAGRTKRTLENYSGYLRKVLNTIGKNYDEITADDIRYYMAVRIQRDGISKVSANNERRALSTFYQWLQKEEIVLKNPMNKVELIKVQKPKKKAFEEIEIEKIRDACRTNRERALVEILLSTWCRVSEVAQIRLDEIRDGEILVHGKGEKDRIVYLNAKSRLALEKYVNERGDLNPYLFARAKYAGDVKSFAKETKRKAECEWYRKADLVADMGHIDAGTIESIIRTIGKRAGVQTVHPHRFRRTGATYALRQGMPLTTVSKLLGHAGIGVTQVYLDISDAELEEAHRKYVK
jgi:site-specific recombinase XerD